MSASAPRSSELNSGNAPRCRRASTMVSNGQTAQNGISAVKSWFSQTRRSLALERQIVAKQAALVNLVVIVLSLLFPARLIRHA